MGVECTPCGKALAAVGALEWLGVIGGLRLLLQLVPLLLMLLPHVVIQVLSIFVALVAVHAAVLPAYLSAAVRSYLGGIFTHCRRCKVWPPLILNLCIDRYPAFGRRLAVGAGRQGEESDRGL